MRLVTRFTLAACLLLAILGIPALVYEYPLSATAIREAHFIGLDNGSPRTEFFRRCIHVLPRRKRPYIAAISILTPFARVVEHSINYSAQQFLDKPSVFRVRVDIYLKASYSDLVTTERGEVRARPSDFWRDLKIKTVQNNREIPLQNLRGRARYASKPRALMGAIVQPEYKPEEIDTSSITIEVLAPDGQQIQTTFELAKLR
jgi:hypothetical protein